ncbi:MAG: TetR/AcrR family transcriptional regulator [Paracoccaceae bacterium]
MARPRNFDIDTAVAKATDVFWAHGYEGANLPDLLNGMGLTRGSLYKAFTDKKTLFLQALAHYEAIAVDPAVKLLTNDDIAEGSHRITKVFDGVLGVVRSGDHRGCMLCTAAAGPAAVDDDISAAVHNALEKMHNAFEVALAHSSTHGGHDAAHRSEVAHFLVTQYVGLRIQTLSRAPIERLDASVRALKDVVGITH